MRRSLKLSIVAIMATAFLASCGGVKVGTTKIFKDAKLDEALVASYYVSATEGFTISETDITVGQTVTGEEFSAGTKLLDALSKLDAKGKFKVTTNTAEKLEITFTTGAKIAKDTEFMGVKLAADIEKGKKATITLTKTTDSIKVAIAGDIGTATDFEGSKTKTVTKLDAIGTLTGGTALSAGALITTVTDAAKAKDVWATLVAMGALEDGTTAANKITFADAGVVTPEGAALVSITAADKTAGKFYKYSTTATDLVFTFYDKETDGAVVYTITITLKDAKFTSVSAWTATDVVKVKGTGAEATMTKG